MTTLPLRTSINRSPLRRAVLLILLALAGFAVTAQAQLPSPSPDGGYPNNNTAEGDGALQNITTGTDNTAIGFRSLFNDTYSFGNTATGSGALYTINIHWDYNTADGYNALYNSVGTLNTAIGAYAMINNQGGSYNMAIGFQAMANNLNGNHNTASGVNAMQYGAGSQNTATGFNALQSAEGSYNTATGALACGFGNGYYNTATGWSAGGGGSYNTADGAASLRNSGGSNNVGLGYRAGFNLTSGSNNIALGFQAGLNLTSGSNNIDIGAPGVASDANMIRIGKEGTQTATFIAGIRRATVASGVGVIVGSNGQLGTVVSSKRFKDEIKPMDKASEAILSLEPVTFRYKHELDPEGIPQFGLVAEQVEKVNPDLVARDADGKIYTVRYEAVNAMLLNEFLKEHRRVEEQGATIAKQQKQIEALTTGLQKVSAQVEANKPAPQVVDNNQ